MKLGIVGCGKVGLHTAIAFQMKGHQVLGFDISEEAKKKIVQNLGSGSLAESLSDLVACDVVFECVPTDPLDETGQADLSILKSVVEQFSSLEERPDYRCKLFVQRSTCPPGTARRMASKFSKTLYAVNPSFVRKKTIWEDSVHPERIAIGGPRRAVDLLLQVYKGFDAPTFISNNYEVVELLKYIENAIDSVLISLWNEFLTVSDRLKIPREDFIALMEALGERDKFRTTIRVPGQAFGMWCLPKDLAALVYEFAGESCGVLKGALATNDEMSSKYGENPFAGTELYKIVEGRIRLTEEGKSYLRKVRRNTAYR